jgi:hypothetical protein
VLDGAKNFAGKAAKEVAEETGLTMLSSELINLTALTLRQSNGGKETNLKMQFTLARWFRQADRHLLAEKGNYHMDSITLMADGFT